MEAVSCLKSLVSAASQFRSNGSDENMVHLLRQLDVRFTLIIGQFFLCVRLLSTSILHALVHYISC